MKGIATIKFQDADGQGEALAIVRADSDCVAIALSLAADGDTEVFMPRDIAKRLQIALEEALESSQ